MQSATSTPTPSVSPAPDGPTEVLQAAFSPHPARGAVLSLRVKLAGPADTLKLKIYSRAFTSAAVLEAHGSFQAGWNAVDLPHSLSPGAWFCTIEAKRGSRTSPPIQPLKLYLLP